MKYNNYTARDFVSDPYFQKWVLTPDAETHAFWENWLNGHPFKKPDAAEAREIITILGFTADVEANDDFISVWNNIQVSIKEEQPASFSAQQQHLPFWQQTKNYQKLAAVLIGFLMMSMGVWLLKPAESQTITYSTAYGEVKTIILPDSSRVSLNAHSVLSYTADWDKKAAARQVWLKGEAFFSVRKMKGQKNGYAKFKVHTDNLTVEVLGTRFNVNERRNHTQVVLQSGKVKVGLQKQSGQQNILMQPGDYVGYTAANNQVVKKAVDTRFYTSWVNNELAFNKTTLEEIALLLEDNYGYQVTFQDQALAANRFTGTIPGNDIGLLFTTLSRIYDLQITQKEKQLLIALNK